MNQQSLLIGGLIPRARKADGRTNLPLTFRTILADPPWDVLQRGGRGAHRHYALMSVEEIAALPVGRLANADAHLWLWVTNATLFAGHMVMNTWGFTYRSCLTWVKPGLGLGSSYLRTTLSTCCSGPKGKRPSCTEVSQPGYLRQSKTTATSRKSSTP